MSLYSCIIIFILSNLDMEKVMNTGMNQHGLIQTGGAATLFKPCTSKVPL